MGDIMPYKIYVKTPFGFELVAQFDDFDEAYDAYMQFQIDDPHHDYKIETDE